MSWRTAFGALALLCIGFGFGFVPGLFLGALGGNRQAYHGRYLEERELIEPIIASDPAFSRIEISERSDGGIWLDGEVAMPADRERLQESVIRAIGEKRGREAMSNVEPRPK